MEKWQVDGTVIQIPPNTKISNKIDNNVYQITFVLYQDFLQNKYFKLDIGKNYKRNIIDLDTSVVDEHVEVLWTVKAEHLVDFGELSVQLRAFDEDENVWTSDVATVLVGENIYDASIINSVPVSEFSDIELRVTTLKEETETLVEEAREIQDSIDVDNCITAFNENVSNQTQSINEMLSNIVGDLNDSAQDIQDVADDFVENLADSGDGIFCQALVTEAVGLLAHCKDINTSIAYSDINVYTKVILAGDGYRSFSNPYTITQNDIGSIGYCGKNWISPVYYSCDFNDGIIQNANNTTIYDTNQWYDISSDGVCVVIPVKEGQIYSKSNFEIIVTPSDSNNTVVLNSLSGSLFSRYQYCFSDDAYSFDPLSTEKDAFIVPEGATYLLVGIDFQNMSGSFIINKPLMVNSGAVALDYEESDIEENLLSTVFSGLSLDTGTTMPSNYDFTTEEFDGTHYHISDTYTSSSNQFVTKLGILTLDGTEDWIDDTSPYLVNSNIKYNSNFYCTHYDNVIFKNSSSGFALCFDDMTKSDLITKLQTANSDGSPVKIIYELAQTTMQNPTYALSVPPSENVWLSGGLISCKYTKDLGTALDRLEKLTLNLL